MYKVVIIKMQILDAFYKQNYSEHLLNLVLMLFKYRETYYKIIFAVLLIDGVLLKK